MQQKPTFGNGKICYMIMPSNDVQASASFYNNCFGWEIRTRGDGSVSFDDGVGEVSGTWTLGMPPASNPGIHTHIMVYDIDETVEKIAANGGAILQHPDKSAKEITAKFSDPTGNVLYLYQHGR